MSLNRLLLRSLAIAAITQQPDDLRPPTLAEDRVYDSRLDPLEFTADNSEIPCVIVYTDDDESDLQNRGMGDGPRRRHVELRVEIVLGSCSESVIDEQAQLVYVVPTTDSQLEARLDMFEQQVKWALMDLPNRRYTNAFRGFVIRVEKISSHVQRDETGNNRVAARRLHLTCMINDDCPPSWQTEAVDVPAAPFPPWLSEGTVAAGYDITTINPAIASMVHSLCKSPSMGDIVKVLTGQGAANAVVIPLLKRLGVNVDAIGPEADPNILAAKGLSHGPDGRIEVQHVWKIIK
jgi:hypothetical protein